MVVTGAVLAWLAVILQFYLMLENRIASIPETIIRFFSFYTILTNTLVAVCFTALLIQKGKWHSFFSSAKTLTAITVYIVIVGAVYNLILRHIWQPQGLQLIVDELLHSVNPVLFLLFWLFFVKKTELKSHEAEFSSQGHGGKIRFMDAFPWLLYPLMYLLYILIRGSFADWYPYPFIDVNQLGISKVLVNSLLLTLTFTVVSFLFIALGKTGNKKP